MSSIYIAKKRSLCYKLENERSFGQYRSGNHAFLTKRKMKVGVEGEESAEQPVDFGVSQGTVLGPILLLCHINDFPSAMKSQVRLFYRPITSQQDHTTAVWPEQTAEVGANVGDALQIESKEMLHPQHPQQDDPLLRLLLPQLPHPSASLLLPIFRHHPCGRSEVLHPHRDCAGIFFSPAPLWTSLNCFH